MTDKMKCCFCGSELENDLNMWDAPTDFWYCPNEKCDVYDQEINLKVWQALIDGKKAQEELKAANAKLGLIANHSGTGDMSSRALRRIAKVVERNRNQQNQ